MKSLKGIGLLLLANILIFVTLSITFTVLSEFVLPAFGIDLRGAIAQQDLLWAFVFGFGGAFISLAFSKQMAKSMLNCQQITHPRTQAEMLLFETVQKISARLHIKMPEVYIYEGEDPNAFATGPTKNNSMVAVSTGLLNNLNEGEVRAVLAHEMGHVYNGDMFTTTILAGLMNTFVYFISRWVYRHVAERNPMLGFGVYIFLQIVLSVLAMIPISWWSRHREFSADRFAANTVGKEHMISALQSIDRWVKGVQYHYHTEDALATMKISGQSKSFMQMFSTHPPIEARVAALQRL
ncbi:MAG: protease HtpX [Nitrospirales bacterium]|nr:protease HtpX [Nitrospira sp.]MDR4499866.1 protease HtpX [Nitrospirales bacterium]